jgi:diguanylate cyclase (GGDEF)-like protein/PAS domain S-box-containing protein
MAELRQAQAQHAEGTLELRSMDDEPALAAFHRSGFSGWAAVVAVPRAALLQPLYRTMAWITIAVALTLLVGGASAWGLNTSLQHVLDSLFAAAASAARGEHGARAHVGGPEDLAELARSFNRMQEQRESDEARLRLAASVFGNATEGILIVDAGMRIIEVNDAFLRLTGYARAELIGQHPRLLQSGRHNAEFYDDMRESLSQRGAFSGQLWDRRRDGSQFAANVNISTVRDEQGQLQHYVALFADITAQRLEQDRIEQMAFTDPLTGLANRRLMQDRLQNAIAQAQRRHHLVAVCAIDLDGFKEVNDTRGHEAGDGVLVAVAERLRHVVRANDTVARQGGDEFTLVLVDLPHAQEADDVAQRALAALRQPVPLAGGGQARISASIGIALYPAHARDPDGLLRAADEAMYTAKRRGRDQVLHAAANGKGPA